MAAELNAYMARVIDDCKNGQWTTQEDRIINARLTPSQLSAYALSTENLVRERYKCVCTPARS